MFRDSKGNYTYQLMRGHKSSIESKEYVQENYMDELISFYESKIIFCPAD